MRGLDPRIQAVRFLVERRRLDGRVKPGHDGNGSSSVTLSSEIGLSARTMKQGAGATAGPAPSRRRCAIPKAMRRKVAQDLPLSDGYHALDDRRRGASIVRSLQ
jgi:hypothetical protein